MILRALPNSRVARVIFWAALVTTFVLAVLPHPPRVEVSDKIQHIAAFATLAALGALAYRRMPLIGLIAALSLFGALIEVAQAIPAIHRDSDVLDWVADTLACAVVLAALAWWRRRTADAP